MVTRADAGSWRIRLTWFKAHEAAERIVRDAKDSGEIVRPVRAPFKRNTVEKIALGLNEGIGEVLSPLRGDAARWPISMETDLDQGLLYVVG
jgi:hypothetical protein